MDNDFDNYSPTEDAVPPPYEPSSKEFDDKIAHTLEHSLTISQPSSTAQDDEFEEWDERKFEAAVAAYRALPSHASGSSQSPQSLPPHRSEKDILREREAAAASAPLPAPNPASAHLMDVRRPLPPPPPPPSAAPAPRSGKERPSWYNEAKLGDNGPHAAAGASQLPQQVQQPLQSSAPVASGASGLHRRGTLLLGDTFLDDFEAPPAFQASPDEYDGSSYVDASHVEPAKPQVPVYYTRSPPPSPLVSPTPITTELPPTHHQRRSPPPIRPLNIGSSQHYPNHRPMLMSSIGPKSIPPPPPPSRPPTIQFNLASAYPARHSTAPVVEHTEPVPSATAFYSSAVSAHLTPQPLRHNSRPLVPPPPPPPADVRRTTSPQQFAQNPRAGTLPPPGAQQSHVFYSGPPAPVPQRQSVYTPGPQVQYTAGPQVQYAPGPQVQYTPGPHAQYAAGPYASYAVTPQPWQAAPDPRASTWYGRR